MNEAFLRTEMLLGTVAMERLAGAHVAVFGLGGVGSWCAEALARSGVGALTLVDHDTVGNTNRNRQLQALVSTLGQPKAEAMARRVLDINPDCRVTPLVEKYEAERRERFFSVRYDYLVDCIDLVSCKLDLIETAIRREILVISALGTGNKLDPAQFRIGDLSHTEGCPLARVVRKELRKREILHHRVLWSPEEPCVPEQREAPPPGRRSVPGSVAWVPSVAGLMLAGDVVSALAGRES